MVKELKIEWLNSLRGLACFIVLIAHIISMNPVIGMYASGCGKIGVWCFMVLSSYLLYSPYCKEKRTFGIKDWIYFYIKRALRIFPVYFVVLIFAYLIGYFADIKEIFFHLLGIHGIGHFWYMPVIMKFYLLMPVFIVIKNKLKPVWNVIILMAVLLLSIVLSPYTEYIENSIEIRWYLPVFVLGMLLAEVIEACKKGKMTDLFCCDIVALICILIGASMIPYMREKLWGIEPSGWLQNKYLLYGVLWSIIIFCITFGRFGKCILAKSKVLSYVGKISFSIYLIHFPVLLFLCRLCANSWINGLMTIVISVLLGVVIHKMIEEPMERVREKHI